MTPTMMPARLLLAATFLALGLVGAKAQTSPPDAARTAAAAELVDAMGGDDQARTSVTVFLDAINGELRSKVPQKAPAIEQLLKAKTAPDQALVKDLVADLRKLAVSFYAERFSTEELKAIVAFQKSPSGRKFQETTPRLMTLLSGRMQDFQGALMRDVQAELAK